MDPPLIHESSFSAANPSSYTLTEIWPFQLLSGEAVSAGNGGVGVGLGLQTGSLGGPFGVEQQQQQQRDGSMDESTVTEQSVGNGKKRRDFSSQDETSKMVSATTSSGNELNDANGKRMKMSGSRNEKGNSKAELGASSAANNKPSEQSSKPAEPPKDYIHVRARRGQATDSHSLAERARREKISERMKTLQDLVPGCNKVIGKALVLDEIINYIQSLQCQVEFLSMKIEAVNSRVNINPAIQGYHPKDLCAQPLDGTGMIFGPQTTREYAQAPQPEWLHTQIGGGFERGT